MKRYAASLASLAMVLALAPAGARAQEEPDVYYQKMVVYEEGSAVTNTPPAATFTAYLNGDERRVLIDNAPRWDGGQANFTGTGSFGVQLGNFPALVEGDTVTVRFTDNERGQQGFIADVIDEIPWTDPNPFNRLVLAAADIPARPTGLRLETLEDGARRLDWDTVADLTYSVYRRALQDLTAGGLSRHVYTRLAEGVTDGAFLDEAPRNDSLFAYIVFAQSPEGIVSSHSAEVKETRGIDNLQVAGTTPTTATLTWDAFAPPVGETAGYSVYRRAEGEAEATLLAYTGIRDVREGTQYTDTRLAPGTTYVYSVRARNKAMEELGESEMVSVQTEGSPGAYYSYASLKVAVLLYKHSNCRNRMGCTTFEASDELIEEVKFLLEKTREFYWRNSKMKLNLEYTFYEIEDYVDFGDGSGSEPLTGKHLAENFGVASTQYDLIYRITAGKGGNYSWGTTDQLNLPGVDRGPSGQVAFSQHPFGQSGGFDQYPSEFSNLREEGSNHIWLVTHEAQHAIDAIYFDNGLPEMGHGDFPELYGNPDILGGSEQPYRSYPENYPEDFPEAYGIRFGKRFDYQATLLREFQRYTELKPEWGDVYEAVDADGDGFPDSDLRVSLDEARFGSSPTMADTDGDGLSDRLEAIDGIYHYSHSDPRDRDTDGDGLTDGEDLHPRYRVQTDVKRTSSVLQPVVDGDVSEWSEDALSSDAVAIATAGQTYQPKVYMSYDEDYLYVAMDLPDVGIPTLHFDFDADGYWYGAGNTEVKPNLSQGTFDTFRSWDARRDVQGFLEESEGRKSGDGIWDNTNKYQQQFARRVFDPLGVPLSVSLDDFPRVQVEMAFPRNEVAGLTLQPGDVFGLRIDYDKVNNQPGVQATTFDQWSYVYFRLSDERVTAVEDGEAIPEAIRLGQNHPNPFRAETVIRYQVRESSKVDLAVYDTLGRRVRTLVEQTSAPGTHQVTWDGRDGVGQAVSSGVYLCRLTTPDGQRLIRKMTLIR